MNWDRWLMTEREDGVTEFTPYEPHDDGSFDVVLGFAMITSLDAMIERGAKKIVQVDDVYDLGNPRIVYDTTATQ